MDQRTEEDRSNARKLIDLLTGDTKVNERDCTTGLRFACDLLSDDDVDEITSLLKINDEHVCDHVVKRLERLPGRKAKKALTDYKDAFDSFIEHVAHSIQQAGIQASVHAPYGRKSIRVDPGPIWLNMKAFYAERQRPDFDQYILERVESLLKQRRKRR